MTQCSPSHPQKDTNIILTILLSGRIGATRKESSHSSTHSFPLNAELSERGPDDGWRGGGRGGLRPENCRVNFFFFSSTSSGCACWTATAMVSPPWEPYPERKRKIEERAKRPKKRGGKRCAQHLRRKNRDPATDSSFSSSSSTDNHDGGEAGNEEDSATVSCYPHGGGILQDGESHARVRPEDCRCLDDGGCGDEDGCCAEDLPGVVVCPCLDRVSRTGMFEVRINTVLEHGVLKRARCIDIAPIVGGIIVGLV